MSWAPKRTPVSLPLSSSPLPNHWSSDGTSAGPRSRPSYAVAPARPFVICGTHSATTRPDTQSPSLLPSAKTSRDAFGLLLSSWLSPSPTTSRSLPKTPPQPPSSQTPPVPGPLTPPSPPSPSMLFAPPPGQSSAQPPHALQPKRRWPSPTRQIGSQKPSPRGTWSSSRTAPPAPFLPPREEEE